MTHVALDRPAAVRLATTRRPEGTAVDGARLEAWGVSQHAGGRQTLHDVSLSVDPGELVAIAGSSGAGKTTLLGVLAGLRAPSHGEVTHDGVAVGVRTAPGSGIGYVPQDDVIHREMPLRRTLRYAARLRLPAGTPGASIDRVVDETLRALDLDGQADVAVRALSGGQRKRASIAAELLTRPRSFFLDEPTSGLDPATSAEVLRLLRRLTERGVTVVLTSHDPEVIERCDRVVFLAREGYLAFAGPPDAACVHFGVDNVAGVYDRLATTPPRESAERFATRRARAVSSPAAPDGPAAGMPGPRPVAAAARTAPGRQGPGAVRQWWLLTRRNADMLVRNRLTLAVLLGSPALVTGMMAMLFRPGAFTAGGPSDIGPTQTVFWIAFAGFFFGLTYGLLQIVGELAVFRRERVAGLGVGPYVAAKVAVLLPVLAGVAVVLVGVLRALDRLPPLDGDMYAALFTTLLVESAAALALGLLASAAVADAAQAALALPMLCFPQVLFAGAIVPVDQMAWPGRMLSHGLANRHAFEALGRTLGLDAAAAGSTSDAYGDAFAGSPVPSWLILLAFTAATLAATAAVLHHRSRG
jgi:ABC transport system ATP-binding/permease protein